MKLIAKLIIDQKDIDTLQVCLRTHQQTLNARGGRENHAQAKRFANYAKSIKEEPIVDADTVQQLIDDELVYLPVLYVNGVLTAIDGVKAVPKSLDALLVANKHAKILRQNLQDKW